MEQQGWLLIGGVIVAASGAIAWLHRDAWPRRQASELVKQNPLAPASARKLPSNHLPVLEYEELIAATGTSGLIREIKEKFCLTDESFDKDVIPVLRKFAEFVQLLPASESHHHAQPGGLLIHLLEVARNALHFREALKLPQGASPEEQSRLGPRWTYGIFLAALLHDIGKPIADVKVDLYAEDINRSRAWNGLTGSMLDAGGGSYTVSFPDQRDYGLHQKLPVILCRSMVPTASLQWLNDDTRLLQTVMAYLSGEDKKSLISEIISRADRESVRQNLLNGPRTRFASARAVPLIERLMGALRRMLDEGGHLALNRPGAAGFIHDECAWFVAGTVADRVREYLQKNEVRREGASGIPEDNSKFFDVWQDYGAVLPNAKGGAMWKIAVQIGEWRETFTVLRFPLSKLYRERSGWPAACQGTVSIVGEGEADAGKASTPATNAKPDIQISNTAAASRTAIESQAEAPVAQEEPQNSAPQAVEGQECAETAQDPLYEQAVEAVMATGEASTESLQNHLQIGFNRAARLLEQMKKDGLIPDSQDVVEHTQTKSWAEVEYLDESESAGAALVPTRRSIPPDAPRAPMAPAAKKKLPSNDKRQPSPAVERFMAWIQNGLADGTLLYNDSSAMVHFVDEGMLLLTPKIIQEFVRQYGPEGDGAANSAADDKVWVKLQREFQRSGYPARNPEIKGSYIFAYATTNSQASRPVNCYLIREPERLVNPIPPANPYFISKAAKLGESS